MTAKGRTLVSARAGLSRELLDDRACSEAIDAALAVHQGLGAWHVASTYREALVVELRHRGLNTHRAPSLSVVYRGKVVGAFEADLLVEDRVLIVVSADLDDGRAERKEVLRGVATADVRVGLAFNFAHAELRCARLC